MDEELVEKARAFAALRGLVLQQPLGFGIHGIVYRVKDKASPRRWAVKFLSEKPAYERERDAYLRLREHGTVQICGSNVPQFLSSDDDSFAISMTIVQPPHVLDFASAWLDSPPYFPDEVWDDWRRKNEEQFGDDWPMAQAILAELEAFGIHMLDPSPSNIRFR
ncbi:MAG TPA: hypothetical protein VGM54_03380 [Chthoniobacter sp.]|jgi:serine/threonine protein kinase